MTGMICNDGRARVIIQGATLLVPRPERRARKG